MRHYTDGERLVAESNEYNAWEGDGCYNTYTHTLCNDRSENVCVKGLNNYTTSLDIMIIIYSLSLRLLHSICIIYP